MLRKGLRRKPRGDQWLRGYLSLPGPSMILIPRVNDDLNQHPLSLINSSHPPTGQAQIGDEEEQDRKGLPPKGAVDTGE